MSKMNRLLALLLALCLCLGMLAGCGPKDPDNSQNPSGTPTPGQTGDNNTPAPTEKPVEYDKVNFDPNEKYVYKSSVSVVTTNWNPHTYQTADASDVMDYMMDSLFTAVYNDALHPVDGVEPYAGYKLVPAMAADYPTDVTASVKVAHPEFNIPEDATSNYAWSVKLRSDLKWDNGDPITAQDFVDSLERVLRGELLNYRAPDYYRGSYVVVNADKYSLQGTRAFEPMGVPTSTFLETGKVEDLYIDAYTFWNCDSSYTDADGNALEQYVSVLDETVYGEAQNDAFSGKVLYDTYFAPGAPYESLAGDYMGIMVDYEDNFPMSSVGLFVSGDNELTFVFKNPLEGFYLMTYGMSTGWLIKPDLYDSLLTQKDGVWSSTYGTSLETTVSYGPYMMSDYQVDKSFHYVKNPNWYGWNSGIYTYVDPTDGKQYDMYQTTEIDLQYVKESSTRKTMFLAGQLMGYGLQTEDFDQYRSSEYCYATPGEASFGMVLNGYMDMLKQREAAADFDQATTDLEMMSVTAFKQALAVSIDRDDLVATVNPARSAGYGLIGTRYVYDPETGALYRDSDQAKQALCDFYAVDPADYGGDLDKAVDAITGFDPVAAADFFKQAFAEGIEAGYITDTNGDGISDQTVTMQYAMSTAMNEFMEKTLKYLNESVSRAAVGTPFEGKISFIPSAVLGDPGWADALREGTADLALCGWGGATMDPFSSADTWTNEDAYWANWFDAKKVDVTMTIDGEELTMTLRDWALCLNGTTKTVNGKDYNFGYGQTSVDNRLLILATLEKTVLGAYVSLPMILDGGMSLLSQQVYYVVEEYSPIMGRGGIQYIKYNYSESEWAQYVADQGGTLQY